MWLRLRDPDGELAMAQSADLVVAQSAGVAVALFGSLTSSVGGVCNRSAAGFASTAIFITQPSVARMLAWPLWHGTSMTILAPQDMVSVGQAAGVGVSMPGAA